MRKGEKEDGEGEKEPETVYVRQWEPHHRKAFSGVEGLQSSIAVAGVVCGLNTHKQAVRVL